MNFLSFLSLPTVVTSPGQYITRCGETVTVETVSRRPNFGCRGQYTNGVREGWHHTGRLYFGMLSANDIIRRA